MLAGPSTFGALLTSLRVGFQTLTIEQKASEIRGGQEQIEVFRSIEEAEEWLGLKKSK